MEGDLELTMAYVPWESGNLIERDRRSPLSLIRASPPFTTMFQACTMATWARKMT
jgi:hypothetical protein